MVFIFGNHFCLFFDSRCKGKLKNMLCIDAIFPGREFPYLWVPGGVEVTLIYIFKKCCKIPCGSRQQKCCRLQMVMTGHVAADSVPWE